jgi:hypothetical protein
VIGLPGLIWRSETNQLLPQILNRPRGGRLVLADAHDPLSRFLGLSCAIVVEPDEAGGETSLPMRVDGRSIVVGFIEIDRMVTLERYRVEARATWTRAIAANVYFGGLLVLVLPSSAARRHMLSRIPLVGADWINHPQALTPRREGAHRCRSRPVIARFGKHAIMISTRRSLLDDLFAGAPSPGGDIAFGSIHGS